MCSRRFAFITLFLVLLLASPAQAAVDFDSLASQIRAANRNGSGTIILAADITLASGLPAIISAITIEGNGHSISGDAQFRIFDVNGGSLTVVNATLTKGRAESGGAIRMRNGARVAIQDSTLSANHASGGGGAIITTGADDRLKITRSSFIGNDSLDGKHGGAILAQAGQVEISRSRFSENYGGFFGGAIHSWTQLNVSNTTFDKNTALAGGAALFNSGGVATMTHVTMVDNHATGRGSDGDAVYRISGEVRIRNSIIANDNRFDDCAGGLTESIGNLSADVSCVARATDDPMLGASTGPAGYYPPLDGSRAVDAADPRFCLETDQIGTPRPQGGGCDIGAIESTTALPWQPPVIPPPPCPLADKIIAANTDAPVGGCPAGSGADIISIDEDIALQSRLPAITSDITIEGNGHTIFGNRKFVLFTVEGGKLSINNLTLTRGKGAIKALNGGDVVVNNSRFIDNLNSGGGGAILIRSAASELVVNNSEFVGNRTDFRSSSTPDSGGAILASSARSRIANSSFVNNEAADEGGAIDTGNTGAVDISNSTFINNKARNRGGAVSKNHGGRLTITNSSFYRNHAKYGGALSNQGGDTTITHVTMLDNTAKHGGAIWTHKDNHLVRLRNSIIAMPRKHYTACAGALTQNNANLISDGSCYPAYQGDPLLDTSRGDFAYFPPQPGSPAINAAHPAFCPATDQIGTPRPQDGGCDIGAIEMRPSVKELAGCAVRTIATLNLRAGPGGNVIGGVRQGVTLTALARTQGWFQVDYAGATGWISADYVTTDGDCG